MGSEKRELQFKVNDRCIGSGNPAYIIAEMSGNHAGSLERAKEIIYAAKESGADCIKIQTYTPDTLTIDCHNQYFRVQGGTWEGENLYSLYGKAYTPWEWQPKLKKLADASIKLSNGDYDVEIVPSNTYEIKLLSTAFENMALQLKEHEKMQHLLAYRDSLTGLRNTNSYWAWITDFDKEIEAKDTDFGVLVFDINYLKETNDRYGHDVGNKLIVSAARLISDIFKRSPVFRIGGDEFLVILQNRDLDEKDALLKIFDEECLSKSVDTDKESISVSIAKGFARYDSEKDTNFIDVFNKADDAMYENKRKIKGMK